MISGHPVVLRILKTIPYYLIKQQLLLNTNLCGWKMSHVFDSSRLAPVSNT